VQCSATASPMKLADPEGSLKRDGGPLASISLPPTLSSTTSGSLVLEQSVYVPYPGVLLAKDAEVITVHVGNTYSQVRSRTIER
jgi:hypothetical protein